MARHRTHHPRTHGTKHDDILKAGKGAAALYGHAGDDILIGGRHIDGLIGGRGNDILKGGAGADVMSGGRGSDILIGGPGSPDGSNEDIFDGGRGHNIYIAGSGRDVFVFNGGINVVRGAESSDAVEVKASAYFADTTNAGVTYDQATGILTLDQNTTDDGSPTIQIGYFTPGFALDDSHIFVV